LPSRPGERIIDPHFQWGHFKKTTEPRSFGTEVANDQPGRKRYHQAGPDNSGWMRSARTSSPMIACISTFGTFENFAEAGYTVAIGLEADVRLG
jgi:hypothetical protein